MGLRSFAETVNEKHMERSPTGRSNPGRRVSGCPCTCCSRARAHTPGTAWAAACKAAGISSTPLTPHIDAELLAHNHLACSGALIEGTGFSYAVPHLTPETLREQVDLYVEQRLFPPLASLTPNQAYGGFESAGPGYEPM